MRVCGFDSSCPNSYHREQLKGSDGKYYPGGCC